MSINAPAVSTVSFTCNSMIHVAFHKEAYSTLARALVGVPKYTFQRVTETVYSTAVILQLLVKPPRSSWALGTGATRILVGQCSLIRYLKQAIGLASTSCFLRIHPTSTMKFPLYYPCGKIVLILGLHTGRSFLTMHLSEIW